MKLDEQSKKKMLSPIWRMHNLYKITTKLPGSEGKEIRFQPNWVQKEIYKKIEEGWNRIIILKPRQLGTTTGIMLYLLDRSQYNPNQKCRTIAHRKDTVTELFEDKVLYAFKRIPEQLRMPIKHITRAELNFQEIGSKYSVDVEARGMTPNILHFSEVAYVEDEGKLQDTLESLSTTALGLAESTANGRGNWFERTFTKNWTLLQAGEKPQWYPMFFAWFDDASNVLPWQTGYRFAFPNEIAEMRAKYRNRDDSPLTDNQLIWWDKKKFELEDRMAELYPSTPEEAFIFSTGRVYPNFSRRIHVLPPMAFDDYEIAMDYGQQNPMAFMFVHRDSDDNFIVFREFYRRECPIGDAAKWLHENAKEKIDQQGFVHVKFADPSVFGKTQVRTTITPGTSLADSHGNIERSSIAEEFRKHKVILHRGTQNAILPGISRMKEYLKFYPEHPHPFNRDEYGEAVKGSPRFFVTEECVALIKEFANYLWPKDPTGNVNKQSYENPRKLNDHCLSGDSMVLLYNGKHKKIKDMVGRCYLVKVNGKGYKCNKIRMTDKDVNVYRVLLSNGSKVECTAEHLIMSLDGWKSALDYKVGDWIHLDTHVCKNNKSYYSRVPWQEILLMWILLPEKWKAVAYRCIHPLQRGSKERFPYTSQRPQQKQQSNRKSKYDTLQGSCSHSCKGVDRGEEGENEKELNRECCTEIKSMASVRRRKEMAFYARKGWMGQKGLAYEALLCLWQAVRNTLTIPIKILSPKLQSESIKGKAQVVDISYIGKQDVYNMEVDTAESFVLSGGVLVHNCLDAVRYAIMTWSLPLSEIERKEAPRGTLQHLVDLHVNAQDRQDDF